MLSSKYEAGLIMKIKVISLPNSDRRPIVNQRLHLNAFQYFDAINVANDDKKTLFDQDIARAVYGRSFENGEIGCAVSHKLAIDEFYNNAENEEWLVIFEDDVLPEASLFPFLASLDTFQLDEPAILLLGHSHTKKETLLLQRLKQPLKDNIIIDKEKFGTNDFINLCGTVGYAINLTASKIIRKHNKIFWPADDWSKYRNMGIKIYHPYSPLIYEDFNFKSTIGHKKYNFHSLKRSPALQIIKIIVSQYRYKMKLDNPKNSWLNFLP